MIRALPLVDLPPLSFGPIDWNWPHAFWSMGTILLLVLFLRRVEAGGRDGRVASTLFLLTLVASLAGTYGLSGGGGLQSAHGVAGGLLGALGYFLYRHLRYGWQVRELIWLGDAAFASAPLPLLVLRTGCLLEHAHAGIRTDSWLAVDYPGGPRWDLALLEMIFFLFLWLVFQSRWLAYPWRLVAFLGLYGAFRTAIEPLRIDFQEGIGFPAALAGTAVALLVFLVTARRRFAL
jgi:hypothetical protein